MSIEQMVIRNDGGDVVRLAQPINVTANKVAERMAARAGQVEVVEQVSLFDRVSDGIYNWFDKGVAEVAPAVVASIPDKVSFKERFSIKERVNRAKRVGSAALAGAIGLVTIGGGIGMATAQSADTAPLLMPDTSPATQCVDVVDDEVSIEVDGTTYSVIDPQLNYDNPVPEERLWTDAISTPLEGGTPEELQASLEAKLCSEPLLLAETAAVLARVRVDGELLGDVNPWLTPFLDADPSEIGDIAEEYVPRLNSDTAVPTDTEQQVAVDANLRMQEDAKKVIALLRSMLPFGVIDATAGFNFSLEAGGLVVTDGIPGLALKGSYDGEFLTFVASSKSDGCNVVIGINTGDGRATVLGCTGPELPQLPEAPVLEVPETPDVETPRETPPDEPEEPTTDTTDEEPTTSTTVGPTTSTTAPPVTTTTTAPPVTTSTTAPPVTTTTTAPPVTTTTTAPPVTTTTPPPTHPENPNGPPGGVIIENSSNYTNQPNTNIQVTF